MRVCPTNRVQSAAIADAELQRVRSLPHTDPLHRKAGCSLVPDNSQNKRCRPASRSSLPSILGAPRRHVLAPVAAPRRRIAICSAFLVSWGLRNLGDASTTSLSQRGDSVTIIANSTWNLLLVKPVPRDIDGKRLACCRKVRPDPARGL